jgi:hypothetical protein
MRYRLRTLLIGLLLITGWALLALAFVASDWGEVTWRYLAETPFPWQ